MEANKQLDILIRMKEDKVRLLKELYEEINKNPRKIAPDFEYEKSPKYWEKYAELVRLNQLEEISQINYQIAQLKAEKKRLKKEKVLN
jgi:hypothetical protein